MDVIQNALRLEELAHLAAITSISFLLLSLLYWYGTRGFANLKKLNVRGP